MSRTYRQLPRHQHRHTRGHAQALRADGIRKGSIPPNPWSDQNAGNEAWMPYKIVGKMLSQHRPIKEIRTVLAKKYGMTPEQVTKVVQSIMNSSYYRQRFEIEGT